jgi:hypothetical protein
LQDARPSLSGVAREPGISFDAIGKRIELKVLSLWVGRMPMSWWVVDEDRMEIRQCEGMIEGDRAPIRALRDQVTYLKEHLGILTEELKN